MKVFFILDDLQNTLIRTDSVPCDREEWGRGRGEGSAKQTSEHASARFPAFIRLAQGVVNAIWLDLGALNQGYTLIGKLQELSGAKRSSDLITAGFTYSIVKHIVCAKNAI